MQLALSTWTLLLYFDQFKNNALRCIRAIWSETAVWQSTAASMNLQYFAVSLGTHPFYVIGLLASWLNLNDYSFVTLNSTIKKHMSTPSSCQEQSELLTGKPIMRGALLTLAKKVAKSLAILENQIWAHWLRFQIQKVFSWLAWIKIIWRKINLTKISFCLFWR